MKRVIFHIGPPKTGSTAIQYTLFSNRELFENKGIGYYKPLHRYVPWEGPSNADFLQEYIFSRLRQTEVIPASTWVRENYPEAPENWLREESAAFQRYAKDKDILILSEECLHTHEAYYPAFWEIGRDWLKSCLGDDTVIDVILYLRRQDDWILSKYKENVRATAACLLPFREALEEYRKSGCMDYPATIARLENAFGKDHILLRTYEKKNFYCGNIVYDFLHATGIRVPEGLTVREMMSNPSMTMDYTEALRLLKLSPFFHVKDNLRFFYAATNLSGLQRKYKKDGFPMCREERAALLDSFAEDNRFLAERYFPEKKGELFENAMSEYKEWNPFFIRDAVHACLIAFYWMYRKIRRNQCL